MIPILILAGIDVALGVVAILYRAQRNYERRWKERWADAAWRALDGWDAYSTRVERIIAADRRSADARKAALAGVAKRAARKAETTAQLQREVGR